MASIIRLYTDGRLSEGQLVDLLPEQAHYLNNVMRMKVDDELLLFNGQDGEWQARIIEARKKSCSVVLGNQTRRQKEPPDLWLCFAPIKKQRLDFVIEKATELGVCALKPVVTRRTIVSKTRNDRLCAQVIEAAEQCERLNIPTVDLEVSLRELLDDWPKERTLFVLDEQGGAQPIYQALQKSKKGPHAFLTGPEGGFDPSELDLLRKLPFVTPISVGPRILRADTAALAALSCWQAVIGDWQTPLRIRS